MYESLDIGHPANSSNDLGTRTWRLPQKGPPTAGNMRINAVILHYLKEEYAKLSPKAKENLRKDRS
jgi:hypothetical protein